MMRLKHVGEHPVDIPPELIIEAILSAIPDFLTGKVKAEGKQSLLKTAIKSALPMVLSMGHAEAVKAGLDIPPPDLKSPQARENQIMYGLLYILGTVMRGIDGLEFEAETEVAPDGAIIIRAITPSDPNIAKTWQTLGGGRIAG